VSVERIVGKIEAELARARGEVEMLEYLLAVASGKPAGKARGPGPRPSGEGRKPELTYTPEDRAVVKAVRKLAPTNSAEVADHLKANRGTTQERCRRLVKQGFLRAEGAGRARQLYPADDDKGGGARPKGDPQGLSLSQREKIDAGIAKRLAV
jgi:hypothetical protein